MVIRLVKELRFELREWFKYEHFVFFVLLRINPGPYACQSDALPLSHISSPTLGSEGERALSLSYAPLHLCFQGLALFCFA